VDDARAALDALARRVERLEAHEEIRQLVARYALALDQRDLDALCGLFAEDVRVGRDGRGRDALKAWFDATLREQFTGTAHVTGNHVIELRGPDRAEGVVYSRNEHETPVAGAHRLASARAAGSERSAGNSLTSAVGVSKGRPALGARQSPPFPT
jgi:uncharacterized protein (TIGR02246 family)